LHWEKRNAEGSALSNSEIADLNKLKARAAELLPPNAPTTLYELVNLRQKASDILHGWGAPYRDIRLEIEALDFEPHLPAYWKNRPVTPDTQPFVPKGWSQEQFGSYLRSQMERYIRLIEAAHRLKKSQALAPKDNRRTSKERARRSRIQFGKNLSPTERRAHTTASLLEELNRLRPRMTGAESDYSGLARENPHFLTFKIARKHPELKEKVLNLQGHRRHFRLAQELAAAHHGVALATVQTDWKKSKPQEYRRPKT
jgi:hypothetical protein